MWNAWYFFTLYANADGRTADLSAPPPAGLLDRYILAKLHEVTATVTSALDAYDLSGACEAIEAFLDALTNWYIRRSRDRFWGTGGGGAPDARDPGTTHTGTTDAFDTLGKVIEVLSRLAAPLMPMISESIWRGLTGGASVHLEDWPSSGTGLVDPDLVAPDLVAPGLVAPGLVDPDLVELMDLVREVCSAAHSVRKANNLRARLPLATLTVAGRSAPALAPFTDLISDEVNVRSVVLVEDPSRFASPTLTVVFKVAAPRLGPATPAAAHAAKSGDWEVLPDGRARVGESVLEPGEFELRVTPLDEATTRTLPGSAGVVLLDTAVTDELAMEGTARDLVRSVQNVRRELGLDVTDRVALDLSGTDRLQPLLAAHRDWIAEQVLAATLHVAAEHEGDGWRKCDLADGTVVWVRVTRI
jgi:isoleucyl-tRNA synthetase